MTVSELKNPITKTRTPKTLIEKKVGGAEGIRTPDPHNAIVVLYQLSYDPNRAAKLRRCVVFVKRFY